MQRRTVTLMTPWPALYHDLIAEGLIIVRRGIQLRTQMKNERRESEAAQYTSRHPLTPGGGVRIAYGGQQVLQTPSKTVLEVMCNVTGTDYATADYRLPIPQEWFDKLTTIIGSVATTKPIMFYRPLVSRTEYRGSTLRNADPAAYHELFNSIRDKFFVISVADLEEGKEWIVGPDAKPDLSFHKGELVFEAMAALAQLSRLVFTSSGFAAILGPAVETPTISIIGGYEDVRCHDSGKKFAAYLALGPERGCTCWTSNCRKVCDKSLNMDFARGAVLGFVENIS